MGSAGVDAKETLPKKMYRSVLSFQCFSTPVLASTSCMLLLELKNVLKDFYDSDAGGLTITANSTEQSHKKEIMHRETRFEPFTFTCLF
ncbi:hypothetical protein ElyMa_003048300 [Elysia marginata]|uniref:Uncharacterized protein n=1 Tax=Elysia marginata TaxID=1093978 RepID=A0AAV4IHN0_9GAST|nr:hypothetical protein ElyMa_003048300 [Elysia marginata]